MYLTLCDFDGVLYNTDDLKRGWSKQLEEKGVNTSIFWYYYDTIVNDRGYFDTQELYTQLNNYHHGYRGILGWGDISKELIKSYPYEEHVLPEATEALNLLRTLGKVIIWSQGEESYQMHKIASCKLPVDGIFVSTDKVADMVMLVEQYEFDMLVVIDNNPTVLSRIPYNSVKIRIQYPPEEPFTIMNATEYLMSLS